MTQEQWQVTGNASEIYEKYLVPACFVPWAKVLVEAASPKPGARVLDVACGTGIIARTAAPIVGERGKVVGLDLNPGMLAVARSQMEQSPVEVEWHEASALEMPLPDDAFEYVICQAGLQFFPDRVAALREMHRVLAPGGDLVAVVWRAREHSPGFSALAMALEEHVGAEAAAIMKGPFVFGDTTDELHSLMREAGFDNARIIFETRMMRFPSIEALFDSYTAGSPIASHVSNINTRGKIIADMVERLSGYLDDDGLAFPIQGHLVRATK